MQEIIKFINENPELVKFIIYLIVTVISTVLIVVLKKKPVKVLDTIKECITRLLPYCITEAEKTDLKGENKKIFALECLYKLLKEFGYAEVYDEYREYAAEQIELILSTPQKKER